jgi:drug/metabolite transporter (DMT)-like permease
MGFGSILLLASGVSFQGLPPLSPRSWLILIVLAVFNTALAFWLWNKSLQVLTAMESSIINNTMLIQISLLAWLFLGEKLTWMGVIGLAIASIGTILVNLSLLEKSNNFVDFYGLVLDTLSAQADPERLY